MKLWIKELEDTYVKLAWDKQEADFYRIYWADKDIETMKFKLKGESKENEFLVDLSTHVNHYFKVAAVVDEKEVAVSEIVKTEVKRVFNEQLEKLNRGLVAAKADDGIFLSWRLMLDEVDGYSENGLTGVNFNVYKNDQLLANVTDSTNYLDSEGSKADMYSVEQVFADGTKGEKSKEVKAFEAGENYIDIPLLIPEPGVTPAGQEYSYNANDMSIGDVDGDGEYEYIVKWDPTNAKDNSHSGYTGNCIIDCYKLDGTILWRIDMGHNIRAGAHYTQFMVYDFDGDGKAEMAVKTAPGTKVIHFNPDQTVKSEAYISMPEEDVKAGYSHDDDYRLSSEKYLNNLKELFMGWQDHSEVKAGNWPDTLEECFGIEQRYDYPLNEEDAEKVVDYFVDVFAVERSERNKLREIEGFVLEGPEYLTMFSGDGSELDTIYFPYERVDDGLLWGDYEWIRIEPGNRGDRFLSGVAYLDGERPYLIVCRGYYTRSTITAYSFFDGKFEEYWTIDSGFVPVSNPFNPAPHKGIGTHPEFGILTGQGNHSLSTADVDGDGYQEIIYGAAVIDHDGSILYSPYGKLKDGREAKFGHGDAMHVANIDPDKPGLEIFSVFENGINAPYGYALRDAETGEVIFGEPDEGDLGRCMIGDINPDVRGLQCWVYQVQSATGEILDDKLLGTDQNIKWAADMSTQVLGRETVDGVHKVKVYDHTHGVMLESDEVLTNNGTKGNAALIADVFGDWREELLVRKNDNSAIRIFTNTDITDRKLYTLMHDTQYRTAVAWQNNCYNQPGYTKFYFASDTDWKYLLPQ